ncbi:hypothetical protein IPJ72_05465 [Candidatus Peregrinibacteria bacterium]|nr:MAG: hypothetical protein IPJ72_05465 [Candidatus Peregrinibacteria bacterium]
MLLKKATEALEQEAQKVGAEIYKDVDAAQPKEAAEFSLENVVDAEVVDDGNDDTEKKED